MTEHDWLWMESQWPYSINYKFLTSIVGVLQKHFEDPIQSEDNLGLWHKIRMSELTR